MSKAILSRRDFLKLSGYGLLGIFLPNPAHFPQQDEFTNLQGRIIDRTVWAYDEPNLKAKRAKLYWHDLVVPITNTTIGEDETAYNRVWYQLEAGGYAYSGSIQPVRTILNTPQPEIPTRGALGEVSVPYTDAYLEADLNSDLIYRLYYETVHWVVRAVTAADGTIWYSLLDDKFEQYYYVPAKHIRLIPNEELAPLSPEVPNENKLVEVRLDDQLLLAYENGKIVFATRISTGAKRTSGKYTTPDGDKFITFHKRPTRHMAAGDIASNGFDLPGVPWVLYITKGGISFHGTYWHNDYGRPHSHGCINMAPQTAKWLYRWTTPSVPPEKPLVYGYVGTRVVIKI